MAVGAAPEPFGQGDNRRLAGVKLPEGRFVVEVERHQQLVAHPALSRRHGVEGARLGREGEEKGLADW